MPIRPTSGQHGRGRGREETAAWNRGAHSRLWARNWDPEISAAREHRQVQRCLLQRRYSWCPINTVNINCTVARELLEIAGSYKLYLPYIFRELAVWPCPDDLCVFSKVDGIFASSWNIFPSEVCETTSWKTRRGLTIKSLCITLHRSARYLPRPSLWSPVFLIFFIF